MWNELYHQFFYTGSLPQDAMTGHYNLYIVFLSYVIAALASYVALDMSAHLRRPASPFFRTAWLMGGAFAMGAGIWSMHFVGMLAFIMPMPMTYDLMWTGFSMFVAIVTATGAFLFFIIKNPRPIHYLLSGIIVGSAIPTMHYTGMAGMNGVKIYYYPSIFCLSIIIAVIAATASIWFSVKSDHGTFKKRTLLKLMSALIMGVAITGMHYTGMFAAVFIPQHSMADMSAVDINPILLAIFITTIVSSIMIVALILSTTRYLYSTTVKNKNDFLLAILDNMRGAVIACDEKGRINLVNDAATALFGPFKTNNYSIAEWIRDYPFYDLKTEQKGTLKDHPLYQALQGNVITDAQIVIFDAANCRHVLLGDGQPLIGMDKESLGAVIVWYDITERMRLDELKNSFISTVNHELRTPLTSIMGSIMLILNGAGGQLSDPLKNLLGIAHKNSERLLLIINDLLDLEKLETAQVKFDLQLLNIQAFLEEAIKHNHIYGERFNVKFEINNTLTDEKILVDSVRLMQVMTNLMSNAAKFSPANETVQIFTTRINNFVRISVKDRGPGIPEEFLPRIFGKFTQADGSNTRQQGGTGLGLCISKTIVEQMGGSIGFESEVNKGSTFFFEFPVATENRENTSH